MKKKKEITMTRNEALILNQVLTNVRISGMSLSSRRNLIGLKIELGKITKAVEDFQKESIEAHKPGNFEELQSDQSEKGKKAFSALVNDLEAKVREVLNPYCEENVTISFQRITSEDFEKLTEINDLTLAAYEFLNLKLL